MEGVQGMLSESLPTCPDCGARMTKDGLSLYCPYCNENYSEEAVI